MRLRITTTIGDQGAVEAVDFPARIGSKESKDHFIGRKDHSEHFLKFVRCVALRLSAEGKHDQTKIL